MENSLPGFLWCSENMLDEEKVEIRPSRHHQTHQSESASVPCAAQ